tara:strand:+ start:324 stop:563 length:240 start_codon:yes stop_codon:yes gene_type:complete
MLRAITLICLLFIPASINANPPEKSKFYNFSDQVIDGEIKKPTALYTNSRQKVKFERLLKFKKSFIPDLLETSKESTFK